MFKYSLPSFVKFLVPNCTWKVATKDKVLYLTFDDGPHPIITPWVIDCLNKYQAKGTFFCVGHNVQKHSETYHLILQNGHLVGNHTFNHLNNYQVSNAKYLENIKMAEQFIDSKLFRPPYGRIKRKVSKTLRKDYHIIMWSKLSRDYDIHLNKEASLKAMLKSTAGDILVFHDSEKAFDNLKFLLPQILEHYSRLGFTFKSLSF